MLFLRLQTLFLKIYFESVAQIKYFTVYFIEAIFMRLMNECVKLFIFAVHQGKRYLKVLDYEVQLSREIEFTSSWTKLAKFHAVLSIEYISFKSLFNRNTKEEWT